MVLVSVKGEPPIEVTNKVRRAFEGVLRGDRVSDGVRESMSPSEIEQIGVLATLQQGKHRIQRTTTDSRGKVVMQGDRVSAIAPSGSMNMRVGRNHDAEVSRSSRPNSVAGYVTNVLGDTIDVRMQHPEPDVVHMSRPTVLDRKGTRGQHMISSVAAIARNRGTAPSFRDDPPSADHRLPADRVWVERMIAHADQLQRSGVDTSINTKHEMGRLRRSIREGLGPRGE